MWPTIDFATSNIPIDLTASPRYTKGEENEIVWKKKVYTKDEEIEPHFFPHIWNPRDEGEDIGKGAVIQYTPSEEEEGKYLKFYAYEKGFVDLRQSVIYYVEPILTTKVEVESVIKGATEARVGDEVTYNIAYSISDKEIPAQVRENIKWMISKNGDIRRLIINNKVIVGEEITFTVPDDWSGCNVRLMPYITGYTQKTSRTLNVAVLNRNKVVAFFIGGAGDKESFYTVGPTYIVKRRVLEPFDKLLKTKLSEGQFKNYSSYYLDYKEAKGPIDVPKNVIKRIPSKDTYVYIIGHSLGGWNGAYLSHTLALKGYKVEMLITLDPVGQRATLIADVHGDVPTPKANLWITISANASDGDDSDFIAWAGYQWKARAAHIRHSCDANHYMADVLFTSEINTKGSAQDYLLNSILKILQ